MGTWMIEWGLLILAGWTGFQNQSATRPLSFEDRVRAQEAVERVYCQHRIWPKENPGPKPPFERMITRAQLEVKVEDYLKKSAALDKLWHRPIQPEQLQAEMDRMAKQTQDPETLKELFAALDNNPYLIAECLARPILADRLIRNWYKHDSRFQHGEFGSGWIFQEQLPAEELNGIASKSEDYLLPSVRCWGDSSAQGSWTPSSLNKPNSALRDSSAVWSGIEMIVWGGASGGQVTNVGYRYSPATDSWLEIARTGECPSERYQHSAVWTGSEMVVWGGMHRDHQSGWSSIQNTGGRYDPISDSWIATSVGEACPSARSGHSAIWTGTEMIIWGGGGSQQRTSLKSGGRFNPATNAWSPTSTGTSCPTARYGHVAVWTGSEMIIWGDGNLNWFPSTATGARYNPTSDLWTPVSAGPNAPWLPAGRTAVWTGTEMIVWGSISYDPIENIYYYGNDGGRYNPSTDSWTLTSKGSGCPSPRSGQSAVWTDSEMIIWGPDNTGSRYDPVSDTWNPTATGTYCPTSRYEFTAVWTGSEMIIWGGSSEPGGRYDPASDSWLPVSTSDETPTGRCRHTGIWTGVEMIIWGGNGSTGGLNDGGRYFPATDTWASMAQGSNCPSARSGHTAVWTGNEMIVWGGAAGRVLGDGGRYDPYIDTWGDLLPTSEQSPRERWYHSAIWTGTEMIVWGGQNYPYYWDYEYFNDGGRYNPISGQWSAVSAGSNSPSGRARHTAVWIGAEMIIWGGYSREKYEGGGYTESYLDTGSIYSPSSDSWENISAEGCPARRADHTAIWSGHEMIIWGGEESSSFALLNTGGGMILSRIFGAKARLERIVQ